jgi:uncharacterized membrane protein
MMPRGIYDPKRPTSPSLPDTFYTPVRSTNGFALILVILFLIIVRSLEGTETMIALVIALVGLVVLVKLIQESLRERAAMPPDGRWNAPRRRR